MIIRLPEPTDRSIGYFSADRWKSHALRRPAAYRLTVLAPSPATVVRQVGGWLFDMRAAGWEVTVCVIDHADPRPLEILGAIVIELEQFLGSAFEEIQPYAVATAMDDYRDNPGIRDGVLRHLEQRNARVVLWGAREPTDLAGRLEAATHHLSVAGCAFKACALTATGAFDERVEATESFWVTDPDSWHRIGALRSSSNLVSCNDIQPSSE